MNLVNMIHKKHSNNQNLRGSRWEYFNVFDNSLEKINPFLSQNSLVKFSLCRINSVLALSQNITANCSYEITREDTNSAQPQLQQINGLGRDHNQIYTVSRAITIKH